MDMRPIGVFDSGLGGLTAVRSLREILPEEDLIYFGDTARVPYGGRARETLLKYARQDVRFLRTFDLKAILIACGTVSTTSLEALQAENALPIVGVVEPTCRRALLVTKRKKVGVIATLASIRSGAYEAALRRLKPGGMFYASFIQVFGGLLYDLKNGGNIVPDCQNPALLPAIEAVKTGENARCEGGFTHSYMWHPRNIAPFMERFGLKRRHLFGQEGITSPNEPQLLERDAEEFQQWVELAKKYLEVPELLAFSEHAMYIGEKP